MLARNLALSLGEPDGASVAIGVPVRNEAVRLPRLLGALAAQRGNPRFTLCLFFDNCDDGSSALVERMAADLPFPVIGECCHAGGPPNAGAARRRAMTLASAACRDGILLTTDADSEPAPDWVAANVAALTHGDVVAGRIVRPDARTRDMLDRIGTYLDRLHEVRRMIDPVPWEADRTHHWTSGASLAFSAEVYRALDGFRPLANGEDAAVADAAARAGYRIRRDADVVVRTSSRRIGRADRGFATALAAFDQAIGLPEVAHPDDEAWRFRMQAAARAAYAAGEVRSLGIALGLPIAEVEQVAAECVNDEAFAARIVGAPPGGLRTVSLAHAEALLAGFEQFDLVGAA
ncbi:glycosyltransferase [Sphingomonas nostoxanthinifaciens]|uniref:glycosyltransferase n=1 Tax=Sphingomonas nostoxanthinifaciens TaxID=2872652 RepID=UPI001CC20F76|nr:glycosyltransferase [Sphingomonas nostoxanthinifaciens]UAK23231.1 glycosyltransferase [Sphingomonas nostoxanthinifaciens]